MDQIEGVTLAFGDSATVALGVVKLVPEWKSANTAIQGLRCYSRRSARGKTRAKQPGAS